MIDKSLHFFLLFWWYIIIGFKIFLLMHFLVAYVSVFGMLLRYVY